MKKFWREWRNPVLIGLGIFILALFLRTYNLTILPIFGDEAIYVRWAQVMRAEPSLRFVPLSDGKQPLFMWSIIPFLKVITNPLFAGRFTSVVTGLGTLVGVFVLTFYLLKSKKVALIASLIYAISPFSVFFDRMALADSMLAFFGIWTLVFGVITAKTLRLDTAMLTGFALGGALLTKSPALFFVILLPTTILAVSWPKNRNKRSIHLGKLILLWAVTLVIAYGMYNILRLGSNFHMIGARNQDYVFPISHLWTNPKDPFIFHFDRAIEWLWMLGPSVFLVFVILATTVNFKKYRKEILLFGAWSFLPILIQSEFAKVFTARYILFSFPPLTVLAATLFLNKEKKVKQVAKLGLAVFVLHALYLNYLLLTNVEAAPLPRSERSGYLEEWTAGTGIKEVADLLREEWSREPKGQIVVGTEGYFGTLPDALQAYLNDTPEIIVIGVGQPIRNVHESLLKSKKAGNRTYLVVNNTRFLGDAEKLGLELLAAYPKAVRPDGSRETLLFFEVADKVITPVEL